MRRRERNDEYDARGLELQVVPAHQFQPPGVVPCRDPRLILGDFGGARSGSSYGFMPGSDVRLGDWYCQCRTHNFTSRSNCFKCNAFKDECAHVNCGGGFDVADTARLKCFAFGGAGRSEWKSGDWICTRFGCNEHNFTSRHECFRLNAPRDYGTEI